MLPQVSHSNTATSAMELILQEQAGRKPLTNHMHNRNGSLSTAESVALSDLSKASTYQISVLLVLLVLPVNVHLSLNGCWWSVEEKSCAGRSLEFGPNSRHV